MFGDATLSWRSPYLMISAVFRGPYSLLGIFVLFVYSLSHIFSSLYLDQLLPESGLVSASNIAFVWSIACLSPLVFRLLLFVPAGSIPLPSPGRGAFPPPSHLLLT